MDKVVVNNPEISNDENLSYGRRFSIIKFLSGKSLKIIVLSVLSDFSKCILVYNLMR